MNPVSARILVVDDQQEMTRLTRRLLTRLGFRWVEESNTVADALDRLRRDRFRLALIDLHMQPTPGTELIKGIQSEQALGAPSVIVMSGMSSPTVIDQVKRLGVDGYLLKPFSSDLLKQNLVRVLGKF